MKKLLFLFAAVTAICFASCGNKTEIKDVTSTDTDTVVIDSVDTLAVDTLL